MTPENETTAALDPELVKARLATINTCKDAVTALYGRLFSAGIGTEFHAFLEWCGVLTEHLNMCRDLVLTGVDPFDLNVHSGKTLPVPTYRMAYLNEKLECIFNGMVKVEPGDGTKSALPPRPIVYTDRDVCAPPNDDTAPKAWVLNAGAAFRAMADMCDSYEKDRPGSLHMHVDKDMVASVVRDNSAHEVAIRMGQYFADMLSARYTSMVVPLIGRAALDILELESGKVTPN